MRFQDWDVLLFPAGNNAATHVPLKEFRTACYVEQQQKQPNDTPTTPLLTTFVPCLQRGAPFQISIHSWTETGPVLGTAPGSARPPPQELWQVRVVIDGTCICVERFGVDATWPQIISSCTSPHADQARPPLTFPHFHRTLTGQTHWDASDHLGRIRVELCGGYVEPTGGRFVKLHHAVNFAFQPAPIDLLEQSGIAWPNQRMYMNPLQLNTYHKNPAAALFINDPSTKHKRAASSDKATHAVPASWSAYPTFVNPMAHYPVGSGETYSRSTSAYSTFSDSAAPLLPKPTSTSAHPRSYADLTRKDPQFSFRLPSDQFQMILKAINPNTQGVKDAAAMSSMPPPPLPAHATTNGVPLAPQAQLPIGSDVINFIDRRAESRYSDVSMHADCTNFPICTSEEDGHIVHATPQTPATVVKGRKEGGSSPSKPRDFFSTILDSTAERPSSVPVNLLSTTTPGKEAASAAAGMLLESSSPAGTGSQTRKRTRSALKLLNLNDGSPGKKEMAKPPRKASRASGSSMSRDKEVPAVCGADGQENMMVDV